MLKKLFKTDPIFYQDGFKKFLMLNSGRCAFVITDVNQNQIEYRYDTGEDRMVLKIFYYKSNKEMWEAFKDVTPDTILSILSSVLENPPTTPTPSHL